MIMATYIAAHDCRRVTMALIGRETLSFRGLIFQSSNLIVAQVFSNLKISRRVDQKGTLPH